MVFFPELDALMPDIQGTHPIRPRDQHLPRYFGPLKFIYRKKSDRATDGQLNHHATFTPGLDAMSVQGL